MRYVGIYENGNRYIASFFDYYSGKQIRVIKGRHDTESGIKKLISYLIEGDRIVAHASCALALITEGFDIIVATDDFVASLPGEDKEDESASYLAFYMVEKQEASVVAVRFGELEKAIEMEDAAHKTLESWKKS